MKLREIGMGMHEKIKSIPTLEYVKKQTTLIGGEFLLLGLTKEHATALIELAGNNGLEISETHLDEHEISLLSKRFKNVTPESVTLYLGHTVGCEKPLYELLERQ